MFVASRSVARMASAADPRQLEDKPSETEENSLRTFFWGSVVLYAAFGIIGLAAVNTVIQFVQQVTLVCNTPMFAKIPASYINNYCYGEVSSIRYITAFNFVIGTLIAAPHYLWLNLAAERYALFCSLVSKLNTVPNSETGHWSPENMAIVERVITVYGKEHSAYVMTGYLLKIGIQLIFAVFGLFVTIYFFDGADVNFFCPRVFSNSTIPTFWPFNHQVQCTYGTLEALAYLRLTDVVFLGVIILGLIMALLNCIFPFGTKGKSEDVAKFHVLSTLPYQYYRSHPLELLAFKSDLGFLVAELFRGHGEQAYCFWECRALKKKIELEFSEMARVAFLKDHYTDSGATSGGQRIGKAGNLKLYFSLGRSKYLVSSLPQTENNFLLPVEPIQQEQAENYLATPFDPHCFHQTEPDSEAWLKLEPDIRGAILSFVALPKKKRKVAVVLKYSTSAKFVSCALARVFDKVIQVNFRCDYKHKDPSKHVSISGFPSTRIKTATFHPYAVLEKDLDGEYKQFTDAVQELWKQEEHVEDILTSPTSRTSSLGEESRVEVDGASTDEQLKADFIVVCPIENEILKSATTTFLKLLNKKKYLSDKALLLSVCPLTVGGWLVWGRDVRDKFYEYLPPVHQKGVGFQFQPRECEHVREVSSTCVAMQDTSKAYINLESCTSDQDSRWCRHDLPLQCGKVPCKFRFSLYERNEGTAVVADKAEDKF